MLTCVGAAPSLWALCCHTHTHPTAADAHTPLPTPPPAPTLPPSHPAAADPHRGGERTQPSAAAAAAPGEGVGDGGGGRAEYVPEVKVDDFDYELPAERIAVRPCEPRDASRQRR